MVDRHDAYQTVIIDNRYRVRGGSSTVFRCDVREISRGQTVGAIYVRKVALVNYLYNIPEGKNVFYFRYGNVDKNPPDPKRFLEYQITVPPGQYTTTTLLPILKTLLKDAVEEGNFDDSKIDANTGQLILESDKNVNLDIRSVATVKADFGVDFGLNWILGAPLDADLIGGYQQANLPTVFPNVINLSGPKCVYLTSTAVGGGTGVHACGASLALLAVIPVQGTIGENMYYSLEDRGLSSIGYIPGQDIQRLEFALVDECNRAITMPANADILIELGVSYLV